MSYKVAVIFHPDSEFWEKDEDYPDEEPYSWTEQKEFESLSDADAWLKNHYEIQDFDEYFASKGFRLQIASDLTRDGMALEVFRKDGELTAELFYSDADGSLAITQVNHPISTEDFELLMSTAKRRLTPNNTEQAHGEQRLTRPESE